MDKDLKKLLRNWLMHSFSAWVVINTFILLPYIYHVKTWGNYIFNTDHTPVTVWQYFVNANYYQHDYLIIFLFLFITEYTYQYLFKKLNLFVYAIICMTAGIPVGVILLFFKYASFVKLGMLSITEPILVMALYGFFYALVRDYFYQLNYKKDIQIQKSESELNNLKAQLNPHFLFNSLNYLYGTALREKAPDTAAGIDAIGEMMRYTITGTHETFVPLKNELVFISRYLTLQQARLPVSEAVKIDVRINSIAGDRLIAPLLLLPFIENAFKYGVSMECPCFININIDINEGHLIMHIANSIINAHHEIKGNNTGIGNTIKRLELLYTDNYTLETKSEKNTYEVTLSIDLNKPVQQ